MKVINKAPKEKGTDWLKEKAEAEQYNYVEIDVLTVDHFEIVGLPQADRPPIPSFMIINLMTPKSLIVLRGLSDPPGVKSWSPVREEFLNLLEQVSEDSIIYEIVS